MKNRILIVEDEEAIAKMISMNLKVSNYDTKIYSDGLEAAEALKEDSEYDLALLDVMLPGMDGFELLEIVKQYRIPVIFLTAKDDIESKIQGLRGGADDYIVKPFEPKELIARIKAVIRRSENAPEQEDTIRYENIEISLSKYTVVYCGKKLELPPKELELLYFLASHPNKVFTREQLLQKVWEFDFYGDSRTVDVHIKRLREKLGEQPSWQIKTVWGVGYKFEVQ